ncbi:MAG: hypothetical protein A2W25_10670 [candidate division Zixibacteria bacterium RBG_16_53_22]|nr:MAG: hypothetical protein A2W25_10670 [candidate division Zixibacteria bacterium RBG_16_53_22]
MKTLDKITAVLVMGSIWGAFEIFGAIGLTELGVPHRSPFLFAFALATLLAAKRMGGFPGSALVMAALASVYKTLSLDLHACGAVSVMAVLIDGAVFEITYGLTRTSIESSALRRSLLAPAITVGAYVLFAYYATYAGGEAINGISGFRGIAAFIATSAPWAALLSIPAINAGFYAGEALNRLRPAGPGLSGRYAQALGILIVAAAWIARIAI